LFSKGNIDSTFTFPLFSKGYIDSTFTLPLFSTGYIYDNEMYLSLCGWNPAWAHVSAMQRKYIKAYYLENCDCGVRIIL